MTDIVLVNPPHSFSEAHRGKKGKEFLSYPPLGLLYLASSLIEHGIKCIVIDAPALGLDISETVNRVCSFQPRAVGITATTPQMRIAVKVASQLRPFYTTILGGAHISADTDCVRRFPYFDTGITGEAEITLVQALEKNLVGILKGERPQDLDQLPFPARNLVNSSMYYMPIHSKRFTSIISSRGCPYDCLYCSRPVIGRNVRFRSPENVAEEVEQCVKDFNVEWFQFVDDTMTLNRERTTRLCTLLRPLNIQWGCQTRVDLVDRELLSLMHKAGCHEISFGVESGSTRVRKVLHKEFEDFEVIQAFQLCEDIGIETTAFFMLGLPTETRDDLNTTVKLSCKLPATYSEFHVTTPFPGSGLQPDLNIWDDYIKTDNPLPHYNTSLAIDKFQKHAYRSFYFRPEYILRRLLHTRSPIRDAKIALGMLK